VDEVPEQLAVLCGGHDLDLLGPVVEDQLACRNSGSVSENGRSWKVGE
jgi:hypothetical protein